MAVANTSNIIRNKLRDFSYQQIHKSLFNPKITPPRQAWVENFVGEPRQLFGLIELHPSVFGVFPRIDFVTSAVNWQRSYRKIDYTSMPTRNELPGGTRKPWPQKGTGRARHGSVNSPIFARGGWAKGPRGPVTGFKIHGHQKLVSALTSMLTVKLAQDDLKIVDTLDSYRSEDPVELEKNFVDRGWGPSVLIVDKCDSFPQELELATSTLNHVNLLSIIGLNTLSMTRYETMVVTYDAIREIESRILHQLVRVDLGDTKAKYRD